MALDGIGWYWMALDDTYLPTYLPTVDRGVEP